jgi:streptogramin lyase
MNTAQSKIDVPVKVSPFQMIARLAVAVLLAALLVPSASAQFIYVANAGEDTVSKIDINFPYQEVARYATWFTAPTTSKIVHPSTIDKAHQGPAPSRIARDSAGNVYVLNRFFSTGTTGGSSNPPHIPVLLKIAPSGGTLTSTGPTALAITDSLNNTDIDAGEAADQRILWAQPIGGAGETTGLGRAVAIDTSGALWVGMYNTSHYYKVNPNTGIWINTTGLPVSTGSHKPYGCQVDKNGKLWSVDESHTLAEIDTNTNQLVAVLDHTNYGLNYSLSVFNGCGSEPVKVYLSNRSGKTYIVYDPQASSFSAAPSTIPQFASYSIGVDSQGNIISGEAGNTGRVIKTTPGGLVLWDTAALGSTQPTHDLHGIIIDDNDDVWAVSRYGTTVGSPGYVIKYKGTGTSGGSYITTVNVGLEPYTYGNTPPPTCPCARITQPTITCEKQQNGTATYSWSFTFTNNSPFTMPATGINISSSQVTNLKPAQVIFQNPVPPNGQATVSGTFDVANPVPGSTVCLDIRLDFGEAGWCCPPEHVCFVLPECPTCAKLAGQFQCNHGHRFLQLSVTNLGPTAAQGAQIFSNTPGVTVTPQTTTQTFPQNTPVLLPLTVTGATPGQVISLSVMLHGPIDPKTGVYSWCCTATVTVTYPTQSCLWWPNGGLFDDLNANGLRDSEENGLAGWTVTLAGGKGTPRTTTSDESGAYHFEEVEPGTYRLFVQPPKGWRATAPKGGVYPLSVEAPPKEGLNFGFTKTR